jgi:hypothetical protein
MEQGKGRLAAAGVVGRSGRLMIAYMYEIEIPPWALWAALGAGFVLASGVVLLVVWLNKRHGRSNLGRRGQSGRRENQR